MRKYVCILFFTTLLTGCNIPLDTLRSVPLALTPTGPSILLEEPPCQGADIHHQPLMHYHNCETDLHL